jgi:hypothetical protein
VSLDPAHVFEHHCDLAAAAAAVRDKLVDALQARGYTACCCHVEVGPSALAAKAACAPPAVSDAVSCSCARSSLVDFVDYSQKAKMCVS